MINMIFASHGKFADGLLDAASMIIGDLQGVCSLGLYPGDNIDQFNDEVVSKALEMAGEDGVMIFSDLFGASPCKASMTCFKPEISDKIKFICITGMNLPLALEALSSRDYMSLEELADHVVSTGKESIRNLNTEFAGMF
jgi:PTS system mannose-specific IIA component